MTTPHHPEKGPQLLQLQVGDRFIGFYLLRSLSLDPFRDPGRGHFLTLVLADRSGTMVAHVWEGAESLTDQIEEKTVVKIEGDVETYQGRSQIRVLQIRTAREGEYDWHDLIPSSDQDPEALFSKVQDHLERIENEHLHSLVHHFYSDPNFQARLKQAPAARKIHHAYRGGLLEHILEVLQIAETILKIYPQIDPDLLRAGALLHDMGKLREYEWEVDIDYSDDGRLLGHITMADEMITDALASMPAFPPELALRLRHMLLAHHGRLEWGSPRLPLTLEAIALHHIDNLGVQINRFQTLLAGERGGDRQWTMYDRLLGRQLYLGDMGETEDAME